MYTVMVLYGIILQFCISPSSASWPPESLFFSFPVCLHLRNIPIVALYWLCLWDGISMKIQSKNSMKLRILGEQITFLSHSPHHSWGNYRRCWNGILALGSKPFPGQLKAVFLPRWHLVSGDHVCLPFTLTLIEILTEHTPSSSDLVEHKW